MSAAIFCSGNLHFFGKLLYWEDETGGDFLAKIPFAAVIFDLDGTLLDSMHVWDDVDAAFLGKRNIPVPEDYGRIIAPMSFRETAEYTIARFHLPEEPETIMAEWNALAIEAYRWKVPLKPGALELLTALRQQGIPLGVCTALSPELYTPALEHHEILHWFDAIVTTDDVGAGKRFPQIYRKAADRLGVLPQTCLVLDDLPAAAEGAGAAGMTIWGVADDPKQMPLLTEACHRAFDSLSEISEALGL